MRRAIHFVIVSLILVVLQTTLARFVTVGTASPDFALLWIVYAAIIAGQLRGTVVGFGTGIVFDLISGQDSMLGLAALCKSIAGFIAGYFYGESKTELTLSTWRYMFAVGIASLLHNAIYFLIFLQGGDIDWKQTLVLYTIPSTLYTTGLAVVPMLVLRRKFQ